MTLNYNYETDNKYSNKSSIQIHFQALLFYRFVQKLIPYLISLPPEQYLSIQI